MPANLTPQYQKAEEEFRHAQTASERLPILERMLVLLPKHKGTEKLQADLKSKLSETKAEIQAEKQAPKGGKVYRFPRQGAAQVVVLGGPNAGKSRIVKELTRAEPEVAAYPFTTREPSLGMMEWNKISVQLIDTPPITESHFEPYLLNIARSADLAILAIDGSSDDAPDATLEVLEQFRKRHTVLSNQTGFDEDDFSVLHLNTLLVATHANDAGLKDRLDYFNEIEPTRFATTQVDLDDLGGADALKQAIYEALGLIRIYTKAPGKPADDTAPYTIPRGGNVEQLAYRIHRELGDKLTHAKVWRGGSPNSQAVGRDFVLEDEDLVELHG